MAIQVITPGAPDTACLVLAEGFLTFCGRFSHVECHVGDCNVKTGIYQIPVDQATSMRIEVVTQHGSKFHYSIVNGVLYPASA